jgi:hypothetical protein
MHNQRRSMALDTHIAVAVVERVDVEAAAAREREE